MKVRLPGGETAYALPELPVHQIAPEDHLRRVLGEWVVEVAHSGNLVVLRTPPGSAHVVGSALDRSGARGGRRHGGRGRHGARRRRRGRSAARPWRSACATSRASRARAQDHIEWEGRGLNMSDRVVLAYSGGLDTSVAVRWLIEHEGVEVVAVAVDVGQAADKGGEDWDAIRERALAAGAVEAVVIDARHEMAEHFCVPALAGERPLRGQVPAGLRAVAPGHRAPPGGRGPPARRDRRRARLHGQGQRPGALRGRRARAGARPRDLRAGAGVGADPRGLHRAGGQVGDPHHGDQGEAVLDRRQPVGQGDRVRRDRGPVGAAARRRVHADPGHRDRRRSRWSSASSRACRYRSTARRSRRTRSSPSSARWPGAAASAASTWSRTAGSGSRAGRSTSARPPCR